MLWTMVHSICNNCYIFSPKENGVFLYYVLTNWWLGVVMISGHLLDRIQKASNILWSAKKRLKRLRYMMRRKHAAGVAFLFFFKKKQSYVVLFDLNIGNPLLYLLFSCFSYYLLRVKTACTIFFWHIIQNHEFWKEIK